MSTSKKWKEKKLFIPLSRKDVYNSPLLSGTFHHQENQVGFSENRKIKAITT